MSVLITGLLVGCGVLVGRLIARGTTTAKKEEEPEPMAHEPAKPASPNTSRHVRDFTAFPCQLGDVVLRTMGDEAWLAGALVLCEGGEPSAILFFSPEAGGDRVVLARTSSQELAWLSAAKDAIVSGEPPTALEAGGDRFERRRRLPLRAERIGTGAPDFAGDVIFAEYTGLGEDHLVVVASKDKALIYRGPSLAHGTYDVLPGDREKEANEN